MNLEDAILELQDEVIGLRLDVSWLLGKVMALESISGKYISPPVYGPVWRSDEFGSRVDDNFLGRN